MVKRTGEALDRTTNAKSSCGYYAGKFELISDVLVVFIRKSLFFIENEPTSTGSSDDGNYCKILVFIYLK